MSLTTQEREIISKVCKTFRLSTILDEEYTDKELSKLLTVAILLDHDWCFFGEMYTEKMAQAHEKICSIIPKLKNVMQIMIESCDDEDTLPFDKIAALPHLTYLHVTSLELELDDLAFPNLEVFCADSCSLYDLKFIRNSPKLYLFQSNGNCIKDVEDLSVLEQLNAVVITENKTAPDIPVGGKLDPLG